MKAMAVFSICLGVIAMMSFGTSHNSFDDAHAHAVALNFATYRRAVNIHALANPETTGTITQPVLGLPSEWASMHPWTNRISGGCCYVFGPASAAEIRSVRELFMQSQAIGINTNGHLVTSGEVGTSLPSFIPANSLVSVIEL